MACLEVLPGDTIQQRTSMLLRIAPLQNPLMHPVHARIHHWFVPYRLIWDEWEDFITGGEDGLNSSTYPTIDFSSSAIAKNSLGDYLGLPIGYNGSASALPFRAYAKIWNEWYRDQQIQTELTIDETSGADATTNTSLQNVSWEKDKFTAARGSEQLGPEVSLPLGTSADVHHNAADNTDLQVYSDVNSQWRLMTTNSGSYLEASGAAGTGTKPAEALYADLSNATAATINDLREAFALQKFAEWRNLYGGRYTEYLRADFGTRSSDARLQRPEYLGGGKQTVQFSEIIQSAPSINDTSDESVGELKGHGIAALRSNRYRRFFEEHGLLLSFLSVKPRTMYHQGISKLWNKRTKEEFYNKHLEGLGSQEIENREIYYNHTTPIVTGKHCPWLYREEG